MIPVLACRVYSRSGDGPLSDNETDLALSGPARADDLVLPFQTVRSGVLGRIVRLGALVDQILNRHDYPVEISGILGQAIALTSLLGTALKFDGNLVLQTSSDGPLGQLVVNYQTPGDLRGYAGFDARRLEALAQGDGNSRPDDGDILGRGHLAITIDPDGDMERYQGIVALDGQGLVEAAGGYFRQSEQLPTFIRLALARHYTAGTDGGSGNWQWRAGGLLLQHVAPEGGVSASGGRDEGSQPADLPLIGEDDDNWTRVHCLAETVEEHELLDPILAPERLLYRLFHEEGVRVGEARHLREFCRCSRQRIADMLARFSPEELADMRDGDGAFVVSCEFCGRNYVLDEDLG